MQNQCKINENSMKSMKINRFWKVGRLGPRIWQVKSPKILFLKKNIFWKIWKIWENPPDCSSGRLRPAPASSDRLGPAQDPPKSISGVNFFYCWDGWFPNRWFRMFLNFLPFSIFLNRLRVLSATVARTSLARPTVNNEDLWESGLGSQRPWGK